MDNSFQLFKQAGEGQREEDKQRKEVEIFRIEDFGLKNKRIK